MKLILKTVCLLFLGAILMSACGPKPQYKTSKGKKKLKYYNSIQYGNTTPKDFSSKKKKKKKKVRSIEH